MMLHRILSILALCVITTAVCAETATPEKEKAAVIAAEKWTALVDNGQYAASWKEAATFFRNAIQHAQWEQAAQAVRKPLGKLVSRKVKTSVYKTTLPGAPDGEYVVIQFETSFENKKVAIETVTPMMDKDGQWRVSGYYIKSLASHRRHYLPLPMRKCLGF